jgi:hypothetical protein
MDHTGFLVYLDGGSICLDSNNFSDKAIMADLALEGCMSICQRILNLRTYQFVHSNTNHVLCHYDRSAID